MTFASLGQTFDANPDTPTSILAAVIALGSLIVMGLLVALRTLWKDGKDKDSAISALQNEFAKQQQEQLRSSLQVTTDSTHALAESAELMERATETVSEMVRALRKMPPLDVIKGMNDRLQGIEAEADDEVVEDLLGDPAPAPRTTSHPRGTSTAFGGLNMIDALEELKSLSIAIEQAWEAQAAEHRERLAELRIRIEELEALLGDG